MPARHGFVQIPSGDRIEELHLRAEDGAHAMGFVESAPYLRVAHPSWLGRLGARLARRPPKSGAWLLRPFDAEGRDVLGLLAAPPADLGPDEEHGDAPRRVSGRVKHLSGGPNVVVEDAWFGTDADTWRVTEGVDFVLDRGAGDVVVVSFGLAPLVVARPERIDLAAHLDALTLETRRLVPADRVGAGLGDRLRLRVGDRAEVWGVCRGLHESRRTFPLGDYRTAPRPVRVVGDEDGTRLVIVSVT